ncbi:MAG TPA: CHC2 zinc finger domain-containing protein [Solirubrobacteraceae bacterium]|nr:CHC2 zinc finger domain-containing protein [Solirubrobacteraceae bacterium]
MLAGAAPGAQLLEIRFALRYRDMGRLFVAAHSAPGATRLIRRLAARTDVYVGVCLRTRRAGGRDAIDRSHLAFVEIDTPDARDRLRAFRHPPSTIVLSGTAGHAHAYYILSAPVIVSELEQANRRLAHALGGDLASVDAARILRPPSSWNHKHSPPAPVALVELNPARRYDLDQLVAGLDDPPGRPPVSATTARRTGRTKLDTLLLAIPAVEYVYALTGITPDRTGKIHCPFHELSVGRADGDGVSPASSLVDASSRDRGGPWECSESALSIDADRSRVPSPVGSFDPLRLVPAPVYFERLTGLRVGRSGKLRCLFHDDRTPSLHVYPEPGRGWYCFGCGRGGSIFDLAALLSGRETRGRDFAELRRELEEMFL